MKSKIFKWQFFVGFFFGLIFGAILGTFLYMKNIDLGGIRKKQKYLIQEVDELTKERQAINEIFKERGLIKEHNEDAVIVPGEEGK